MMAGDRRPGNDLVVQWLPFARRIARKQGEARLFSGDIRDLEQAAAEGLCRARDSFDPSRGAFSTHAAYEVRAAVQSELARHYIGARSRRKTVTMLMEPEDDALGYSAATYTPRATDAIARLEARDALRMVDDRLRMMPRGWSELIVEIQLHGETAVSVARRRAVSRQAVSKQLGKARSLVGAGS